MTPRYENTPTVAWVLPTFDALQRAVTLLMEIEYAALSGDDSEHERLVDALRSLPNFPHDAPPDARYIMSLAPKAISIPKITGREQTCVLDVPSRRFDA